MNKKNIISAIYGVLVVVMLQLSLFVRSVNGAPDDPKLFFGIQYPTDATGGPKGKLPVEWNCVMSPQGDNIPTTGGVVYALAAVVLPEGCRLNRFNPGTLKVSYKNFYGKDVSIEPSYEPSYSVPSFWVQLGNPYESDGVSFDLASKYWSFPKQALYYISVGTSDFKDGGCVFSLTGATVSYYEKGSMVPTKALPLPNPEPIIINNKNLDVYPPTVVINRNLNVYPPVLDKNSLVGGYCCGYETWAREGYGVFDIFNPQKPGIGIPGEDPWFAPLFNFGSIGPKGDTDVIPCSYGRNYFPYSYAYGFNRNISISTVFGNSKNPDFACSISDVQMGYLPLPPAFKKGLIKNEEDDNLLLMSVYRESRRDDGYFYTEINLSLKSNEFSYPYSANGTSWAEITKIDLVDRRNGDVIFSDSPGPNIVTVYPSGYNGTGLSQRFSLSTDLNRIKNFDIFGDRIDAKGFREVDPKKMENYGVIVYGVERSGYGRRGVLPRDIRPLGFRLAYNKSNVFPYNYLNAPISAYKFATKEAEKYEFKDILLPRKAR